jgi:hypothetical protein
MNLWRHIIIWCSCVGAVAMTARAHASSADDFRIYDRIVPDGFECEAGFFELLKWPTRPLRAFDASQAPHWDLVKLSEYIPAGGIRFSDVNHSFEGLRSREEILRSLEQRKGEAFTAFAHLSSLYSIPYKQYSELQFSRLSDGTIGAKMAHWYVITFRAGDTNCQVARWEYSELEGD